MTTTKEVAQEFLSHQRFAVTGVSRHPKGHGSNAVYDRLKKRGYNVTAVNPNAETIDGDPCYPTVGAIPGGVEVVVIGTRPERAATTMQECIDAGVTRVWMHRGFGAGSVSPEAAKLGREHGVTVIDGACPLMYGEASDGGHRFICRVLTMTGKVPRAVA